jgi:hypothetical protein
MFFFAACNKASGLKTTHLPNIRKKLWRTLLCTRQHAGMSVRVGVEGYFRKVGDQRTFRRGGEAPEWGVLPQKIFNLDVLRCDFSTI